MRRILLAAFLALATVVTVAVYLLPNVTAASFITVQAIVSCDGRTSGPGMSPAEPCSQRLEVAISIDDGYPMPVTLGFAGNAFEAQLRATVGGRAVWAAVADDPSLEQTSDSGVGEGDRAAVVPSGTTRPGLSWPLILDLGAARIAPGTYQLTVRAYGIESTALDLRIGPPAPAGG
ncbi:MAG: hypothetical protein ACRDGL_05750 [Candidatus Limnocylindrales bacterium]